MCTWLEGSNHDCKLEIPNFCGLRKSSDGRWFAETCIKESDTVKWINTQHGEIYDLMGPSMSWAKVRSAQHMLRMFVVPHTYVNKRFFSIARKNHTGVSLAV